MQTKSPCTGVQSIAEHLTLTPFFSLSSLWRQKALQEQGEIRIIQLGFDLDAQGIIFTEDYRTRVRVTVCVMGARGGDTGKLGNGNKKKRDKSPTSHLTERAQVSGKYWYEGEEEEEEEKHER